MVCHIVEPAAGDSIEENLNPVGRIYYWALSMICIPTPFAHEKCLACGAQVRPQRLTEVIRSGAFHGFPKWARTPLEAA